MSGPAFCWKADRSAVDIAAELAAKREMVPVALSREANAIEDNDLGLTAQWMRIRIDLEIQVGELEDELAEAMGKEAQLTAECPQECADAQEVELVVTEPADGVFVRQLRGTASPINVKLLEGIFVKQREEGGEE